jgi:hypothetical protein
MNDGMEGVVLTGDEGSLFKWKTSIEDESETHSVLCSLMRDYSPTVLKIAGVDVDLVQCLIDVATKKPNATPRKGKVSKPKRGAPKKAVHDEAMLETALVSAMSKYDALDVYFDRGDRSTIISLFKKELVEDLVAATSEEIKLCLWTVEESSGENLVYVLKIF